MSGETKPALRRIRTYAEDLNAAQGLSAAIADTDSKESTAAEAVPIAGPTEKAAPAKAFSDAAPAEHIPAFHELQKKAAGAHIVAAPKPATVPTITVRAKKHDLKQARTTSGGTIITDTKRTDLNFFSAVIASVKKWFAELAQQNKKKNARTYSVTDTELRKGVIQKATSKTGTIFTADAETLKDEIRRRGHTPSPDREEHDLHVSWSPQTEAGYPLLTGSTPVPKISERVVVEFKKRSLPQPTIVEPSVTHIPEAETAPSLSWEAAESSQPSVPTTVAPSLLPVAAVVSAPIIIPTPTPAAVPLPPTQMEFEAPIDSEPAIELPPTKPAVSLKDWFTKLQTTLRHNTNALTLGIASVLLFCAVLAFVVQGIVGLINAGSSVSDEVVVATPLIGATVIDLPVQTNSQEAVIAALGTQSIGNGMVQEFRLTDVKGVPLPLELVLSLVGFSNNKNLNQTITDIHIISRNSAHGVVFTVTDTVSAFGALLAWEPNLLSSLSALLAIPNDATGSGFVDANVGGADIRILTSQGKELVTYGFISTDTVVITSDTTTFESLLSPR